MGLVGCSRGSGDRNKAFSAFVGQVCVLAIGEVGVVGAVGVIIGSSSKSFSSFLGRLEFITGKYRNLVIKDF